VVTVTAGYTTLAAFYSGLLLLVISQKAGWIAGVMRWGVLRALGTISYCVYVIHETFDYVAHALIFQSAPQIYNLRGVSISLLALALTLVVASLSWRHLEKPLLQRGQTHVYGGNSSETAKEDSIKAGISE
jgi:peptidoglycan/LPS O-acetylase OafA/YrhL